MNQIHSSGIRIEPYEWVLNLIDLLVQDLHSDVMQLHVPTLNKIAKLFNKATRPILPDEVSTQWDISMFRVSDFERGLVRRLTPNSSWRHFVDYLQVALNVPDYDPNPIVMGVANMRQLNEHIARFFRSRVKHAKRDGRIQTLFALPNGFHIVQLLDEMAYRFEGRRMDNCVGDYWPIHRASEGDMQIWSVRDADNRPYATLELDGNTVIQIEGRDNGPVTNQAVKEALLSFFKLDSESEKSHSIYHLEDDCLTNLIGEHRSVYDQDHISHG